MKEARRVLKRREKQEAEKELQDMGGKVAVD